MDDLPQLGSSLAALGFPSQAIGLRPLHRGTSRRIGFRFGVPSARPLAFAIQAGPALPSVAAPQEPRPLRPGDLDPGTVETGRNMGAVTASSFRVVVCCFR